MNTKQKNRITALNMFWSEDGIAIHRNIGFRYKPSDRQKIEINKMLDVIEDLVNIYSEKINKL